MNLTLQKLAQALELDFQGNPELELSHVASLKSAGVGALCFVQEKKYLAELATSRCTAIILSAELETEADGRAVLFSPNPYYSFIQAIELFQAEASSRDTAGIHSSAQIAQSAKLADGISIGPLAVIEDDVEIGESTSIGAGSVVEKAAMIGKNCRIHSRVTIGHSVKLGDRCELHAGVVLGSDGFGLLQRDKQWLKVPHLGSVIIEDDVEIGANSSVDRGALDDTIIEQGCKLDNLIQVAHNVRIGAHTAIAACVGIAGSANIGRYCKISGAAVVLGHLSIADNVTITAMSLVTNDIKTAGVYSSGTPLLENNEWHKNNARYKSLDKLARRVTKLEKKSD